ncbi:MAG: CrcB family protein [Actinomycetaceae bacterium]|nr:CrcB family protein [Actinomycetaceae bacterium]MDY6082351.1 CrcB family protein [Actinomycetaceae bacterium]
MSALMWIAVAVCGGAGACGRAWVDGVVTRHAAHQGAGTLTVNTLGCLLLGFITGFGAVSPALTLGFLGGFTTFSTAMLDIVERAGQRGFHWAILLVLQVLAPGLAYFLAQSLGALAAA